MSPTLPKQDGQRPVVHQHHRPLLHTDGIEMSKQEIEIEIMWETHELKLSTTTTSLNIYVKAETLQSPQH